jgi:multisubunit Na+/H+ antiporter MnhG subunit
MKWYNYLACFFAGVFLIHIVPHLMHGMSAVNIIGVLVSLVGGCLLLWSGKFSLRNPLAIVLVLLGMAAVLIFAVLHPHHYHGDAAPKTVSSKATAASCGGAQDDSV